MTWFCPSCFAELPGQAQQCPGCGANPAAADRDFDAALIGALRHPLHDRRLLAARVLGARRMVAAVPALIAAVEDGDDPYLSAEAARALVAIGAPEGLAVTRRLATDGPVVARAAAREALGGSGAARDPQAPSAVRRPGADRRDRQQDREAAAEHAAVQQGRGAQPCPSPAPRARSGPTVSSSGSSPSPTRSRIRWPGSGGRWRMYGISIPSARVNPAGPDRRGSALPTGATCGTVAAAMELAARQGNRLAR